MGVSGVWFTGFSCTSVGMGVLGRGPFLRRLGDHHLDLIHYLEAVLREERMHGFDTSVPMTSTLRFQQHKHTPG